VSQPVDAHRRLAQLRHAEPVRLILNLLWLIFGGGLLLAVGYGIAALICFALIVTIPFGIASLGLAGYALWPFGRTVVSHPDAGVPSGIANILWVVLTGWWLALTHITAGIALCLTIIGIPFGIANFKLVPAAFWPLGRQIVDLHRAYPAPRFDHPRPRGTPAPPSHSEELTWK
jgi:uncharacterized membrane protein YccF (DUF307 family)